MKKTFLLLSFFLLSVQAKAQSDTIEPIPSIIISDVSINTGWAASTMENFTLNDFRKLAPEGLLLIDVSGLYSENYGNEFDNAMFSILVHLKFANKNKGSMKLNPQVRAGVMFYSSGEHSNVFYKQQRTPVDTLTSNSSSTVIYVDSVSEQRYYCTYSSHQIRLDLSVLFSTNGKSAWKLYGGLGFTLGSTMNNTTSVRLQNSENLEYYFPGGQYYATTGAYAYADEQYESFVNKNSVTGSIYAPLGVSLRLGKKREFWKRLQVYYELRPSIDYYNIPEIKSVTSGNVNQMLGLKISCE